MTLGHEGHVAKIDADTDSDSDSEGREEEELNRTNLTPHQVKLYCLLKTSDPPCSSMRIFAPSVTLPSRIPLARLSWTLFWRARLSGLAPYAGSYPLPARKSRAESVSSISILRSSSRLAMRASEQRMLFSESFSLLLDLLRRWSKGEERDRRHEAIKGMLSRTPDIDWESICLSHEAEEGA